MSLEGFLDVDFEQKTSRNRRLPHPPIYFHLFFKGKTNVSIKE
jgi:hypothetical protein